MSQGFIFETRCNTNVLRSRFVQEHDKRVVDQLQGDGETFLLPTREHGTACVHVLVETQVR